MLTITEPDWKLFRKKVPNWQERYMEQLSHEYIELLSNDQEKASVKFWKLEKRLGKTERARV